MLVVAADAASTSGIAFSSRIKGFVNNLLNFVKVSRENERKGKNEENERVTGEVAFYFLSVYSFNT